MDSFKEYMDKFYSIIEKYHGYDIVTNCATCKKTLKSYSKWSGKDIQIRNIFDYIKDSGKSFELKKLKKVTYHKPCNLDNFESVQEILKTTKNLEYVEMKDYDKCCGMEGIGNRKDRKIMSKIFKEKHQNIKATGAKIVLTSCLACKMALQLNSHFKYKVQDLVEFLARNVKL